jgi:hypothetical protein
MGLEELTGYPFQVSGPCEIAGEPLDKAAYGWHGVDTLPTRAEWLCDLDIRKVGHIAAIVLMDVDVPPDDLPEGWTAERYEMRRDWSTDDGVWIAKAVYQKADGSWIFAGYLR